MKCNPSSVGIVDRGAGYQFRCFWIIFTRIVEFLPEPLNDRMEGFDVGDRTAFASVHLGRRRYSTRNSRQSSGSE